MKIRLDKFICDMGYASRREIKDLARRGAVTADGKIIKDSSFKVDTGTSDVFLSGERIEYIESPVFMMNKPRGYVCSNEDPRDIPVTELLVGREKNMDLFTVGRLDKDTVGLLLLTNDGPLCHRLLSPKSHVDKKYFLKSDTALTESDIMAFREGVIIENGVKTLPAELEILADPHEAYLTIHEGKFHQIKRMLGAVKKTCIYLERVEFGGIRLDPALDRGEYRPLTEEERRLIL